MASPSGEPTPPVQNETPAAGPPAKVAEVAAPAPVIPTKPKPHSEWNVEDYLFNEGFSFDFFQAVRLMEKIDAARKPVGRAGPPHVEAVRFRVLTSLSFPPSSIYEVVKPTRILPVPAMTVAFMGLFGPSGMLPRHYTELLIRIDKEGRGPEKNALRDWLDLFNHRFISLFYRAWEKYRFYIPYERGEYRRDEPDTFTLALFSLIGLGMKPLRSRLRVSNWVEEDEEGREQPLAQVDDLVLLHYSGFLSHRPRSAVALEALLADYFQLPVEVRQFQGQWLALEPDNQSRMGSGDSNNQLGLNVVAGERVWDVQSKFRVRLGPLDFAGFTAFLPDRAPLQQRKAFFLLTHLVRLYAGPEYDFEVQLVLRKEEVPECQLGEGGIGPRLGWNTWVRSLPYPRDAEEPVFASEEVVWVDKTPPLRNTEY